MNIVDRTGVTWATVAWDGDRPTITVPGVRVDGALVDDPLLGASHVIICGDRTTAMSALDWRRPTQIPTIAAPAVLPPGSGSMLMNVIATLARDAGVPALRYAGRYPTAALFHTLCRSFRTDAEEDDFTGHFQLAGPPREIPIDFTPAPFERLANPHGYVELRDGIERAVVDTLSFERGASIARLVEDRAELWFGDAVYAHVATFDAAGQLVDGPHPIPACTSPVIGKPFPPPLVEALAELVSRYVPSPLADDARTFVAKQTIRWADLGAKPAAAEAAGFAVHAVLWERLAPTGMARLAQALAEALAPVVTRALVAEIARDVAVMSPAT